jgi:hypothetical protein
MRNEEDLPFFVFVVIYSLSDKYSDFLNYNNNNNNNNSIQFFIISVLHQQPEGQLQKQHKRRAK